MPVLSFTDLYFEVGGVWFGPIEGECCLSDGGIIRALKLQGLDRPGGTQARALALRLAVPEDREGHIPWHCQFALIIERHLREQYSREIDEAMAQYEAEAERDCCNQQGRREAC